MIEEPVFRDDLYRGTAEYYDRFRLPYPNVLVDDLRRRARLESRGKLLDLACGTGQVALTLGGDFDEIVAIDQEPESVAVARAKAEAAGLDRISWQVGKAEEVDVGGTFDMVTIGNAFHRLPRARVAERSMRWLGPGGHLVLLWGGNPMEGDLDWQKALRHAFVNDWQGWTESTRRFPEGWLEAIADDPHEQVLRRSGLDYQGRYDFSVTHTWTIEALTGFLFSTSILSRRALGDSASLFERDLAERLAVIRTDGRFEQEVTFAYEIARRPR